MSWAHDDLLREKNSTNYDQLTPQEKMARCKQKRREQVERWLIFDQSLPENSKIHFTYHRPRRKKNGKQRKPLVEKLASSHNGVSFLPAVALLDAVNSGDVQAVKYMLKLGADPNSADEDGLTALHQACIDNCEEIVQLLLEYGSNVDCRDSEDWTPLHACTTCGHINIAKILLNNGADLLALNADLSMPYDICEDDSPMLEFIEYQMESKNISQEQINAIRAYPENRILQDVRDLWNNSRRNPAQSYTQYPQKNKTQVQDSKLPPTSSPQTSTTTRKNQRNNNFHVDDPVKVNSDRCTLLHIAAANGYLKLCRALLYNYKANPDSRDKDGWTPLHAACCWSQRECLQMLVESGADVAARNKHVEKPAEVTDDQDIVAFLNHLIREQRQRRRKLEAEHAAAQKQLDAKETPTTFNRSQGSRRSARSQSFRRRSIRKGNKDNVQSNSASNIENTEEVIADPHASEARLEAAFWRGEVAGPQHQAGESTSSSERGQILQHQQQAQQAEVPQQIKSPTRNQDGRATAAQRLANSSTSPPSTAVQRTFQQPSRQQPQQATRSASSANPAATTSISFQLPPDQQGRNNVNSPINASPSNQLPTTTRNKDTGCCIIV